LLTVCKQEIGGVEQTVNGLRPCAGNFSDCNEVVNSGENFGFGHKAADFVRTNLTFLNSQVIIHKVNLS
jgi:hypothetical protein